MTAKILDWLKWNKVTVLLVIAALIIGALFGNLGWVLEQVK